MRADGLSADEIARQFEISTVRVSQICNLKRAKQMADERTRAEWNRVSPEMKLFLSLPVPEHLNGCAIHPISQRVGPPALG